MTHITPDRLAGLAAELTRIRRDIHRHPETAGKIAHILFFSASVPASPSYEC